jgi:prevent-host-death family protein
MSVVTIHQAKTNLSRLIAKASEGEEVIIARGSKPVARLVPVGEIRGKRQPGSLKGRPRQRIYQSLVMKHRSKAMACDAFGEIVAQVRRR